MLITVTLVTIQLVSYSRIRNSFPLGFQAGGVPIGGLNYEQAAERIYTVYRSPIELDYAGSLIQVRPAVLGFEPDVDNMLAVADNRRVTEPFWEGFWNFLWNREIETVNIPLQAEVDEPRIREYLRLEISPRYDTPPQPPQPIPGITDFGPGDPGTQLYTDRAVVQLVDTLESPTRRRVTLALEQSGIPSPSVADLEVMLKQIIDTSGFDGIVELYLQDLEANRNILYAYQTEIGERGVTLSGGQRQRIAIARAFLTNPRILILDDSTSAIDSATEDQIQKAMRQISRQRTTFLITHRLSQIRWADHILVMRRGELVDQGTHDDLMGRSPEYQKIFARYD